MPSFKQLQDNETVDNAYSGKVIVYLESEEDLQIIKERWFFDEGKELEFKSVDTGQGGGCLQVINCVNKEREKGIPAFGIVDRDILMTQGELWWEVDDQKFKEMKPFGDYIFVLRRWEIENYLLCPKELEIVLSDKAFRSVRKDKEVLEELFKEAENLKLLSAATILFSEQGQTLNKGVGFGQSGQKLKNAVEKYLSNHLSPEVCDKLSAYLQKIEEFAQGETTPTRQRWERLNRLLDGKRTLQRLDLLHTREGKNDQRATLARHIRINNQIDPELKNYIEELKKQVTF